MFVSGKVYRRGCLSHEFLFLFLYLASRHEHLYYKLHTQKPAEDLKEGTAQS